MGLEVLGGVELQALALEGEKLWGGHGFEVVREEIRSALDDVK